MQPASYWRQNKLWKSWIGKTGVVLVSTVISVAPPEQSALKPYSYVLVEFGKEKHEFMGVGHEVFESGDKVECVLRRITFGDDRGLIGYGIKVRKI
jgi:uncharacterized OB-fold protein